MITMKLKIKYQINILLIKATATCRGFQSVYSFSSTPDIFGEPIIWNSTQSDKKCELLHQNLSAFRYKTPEKQDRQYRIPVQLVHNAHAFRSRPLSYAHLRARILRLDIFGKSFICVGTEWGLNSYFYSQIIQRLMIPEQFILKEFMVDPGNKQNDKIIINSYNHKDQCRVQIGKNFTPSGQFNCLAPSN